jgi:hypothetical protein
MLGMWNYSLLLNIELSPISSFQSVYEFYSCKSECTAYTQVQGTQATKVHTLIEETLILFAQQTEIT